MIRAAFIGLGLLVAVATEAAAPSEPRLVNGYAAIVNNRVITYEDVDAIVRDRIKDLSPRFTRQPQELLREINRLRQEALMSLVEKELILAEFESKNYQLPENLIDEQIRSRIREDFLGDRARMVRTLHAQSTTTEEFRQRVRERFVVNVMVMQNIASEILISPHKIEKYYREHPDEFRLNDRVKLRIIYLANKAERDAEATRRLADDLRARIQGGEAFAEVAKAFSEDESRRQGGARDWVERGKLREELNEAAFRLKPSELSEVIQIPSGCYLILVEEVQPAHVRPLADARDEIERILQTAEQSRLRDEWVRRLRAKAFVRLFQLN